MPNCLDATFGALADPTRRAVIAQLASGSAAVSELAEPFDMAMPSFLLHIRKLERAGLLRSEKVGRVRTCYAALEPLAQANAWIEAQQALWNGRLDRLEAFLDENP